MATKSELDLTEKFSPEIEGKRVLEVGSAAGMTKELKGICKAKEYLGLDMRDGTNVDIVHNLNEPLSEMFDVVLLYSVLEHCDKPYDVARNISNCIPTGGLLLASVPFQWRVHGYPSDYWRFTPTGFKILFPDFDWVYEGTDPNKVDVNSHRDGKVILLFAGRRK